MTVEEISASLEGALLRTLEAKAISASLEGHRRGPSIQGRTPPRSRHPRLSPLRALGAGAISASFETAVGGPGQRPNHPTGRAHLLTNYSTAVGIGRYQAVSADVGHHAGQRT